MRIRGASADEREMVLHTFGNLTLINGKLNPHVSNGPWSLKKGAILEHSALTLNRQLRRFETWDEVAIRARGEELFELARQVWPFPGRRAEAEDA